MTGCEVRVEAWLRSCLPEGPVESFTPQQQRVHELATDWRECFESYGEEHGATLGCLLALVREAYPSDWHTGLRFEHCSRLWMVWSHEQGNLGQGVTECDALVAALEAAP